ncbi:hypothetical protein [Trichoplusia ni single nucleopolyhedrovirus]|uniref:Ac110 n=1 Tax=Trichoplusia ni single nucleopolyhedrovirus TaxID=332054 RepID=Q461X3_9ABAC|nr:hypothetical protein TNSV_gp093 [Trichoplusia ni single nucleopolyhedrovirus]AAZ67463.1 hypothetical protein [Trichoplusia ni single nucleopolyhedrovirus]
MIVYVVLLIVVFVVFLTVLVVLAVNKIQLRQMLYYQYKFIPEPLIRFVTVDRLKTYDDVSV